MDSLEDADQCDLGEFHSLIIPPHYLYCVNKLRRRHPDEYSKVLKMRRGCVWLQWTHSVGVPELL